MNKRSIHLSDSLLHGAWPGRLAFSGWVSKDPYFRRCSVGRRYCWSCVSWPSRVYGLLRLWIQRLSSPDGRKYELIGGQMGLPNCATGHGNCDFCARRWNNILTLVRSDRRFQCLVQIEPHATPRLGCKKVHNFYERIALKRHLSSVSVSVALIVLFLGAPVGASTKSRAATLFEHYSNVYMYAAFNKGMKEQNSSNPTTSTAGINLEIQAINRFDNLIQTIKFPKSDKSALNKVLIDDSVWVSLDKTLAINTSDVNNYNSLFSGVQTAQANATAAIHILALDLGLN